MTKADNSSYKSDIGVIKQKNHDIYSVIEKISSLCKNKDMHSKFAKMSHIADVTTDKQNYRFSHLTRVSDLYQLLFKNTNQ